MLRSRALALTFSVATLGCEVIGGGGGLPEPDLGVRRLEADAEGPVEVRFGEGGYLASLTGSIAAPGDPSAAATSFVATYPELFGFERDGYATEVAATRAVEGGDLVALATRYRGVEIEGGLIVFAIAAGRIRYVASSLPQPAELEVTPATSEADAVAALAALYMAIPSVEAGALVILDVGTATGEDSTGAALAWRIPVAAPEAETVFVSAVDGAVLLREPAEHSGLERAVYDGQNMSPIATALMGPILATEAGGVTAPLSDLDAHQVYEQLGESHAYFDERFGWDSYDGGGSLLEVAVRYSNANGSNAFWSRDALALAFTAGMTTPDIVHHELTHGVEAFVGFGAPKYVYRSGALNEALADTFAAFYQTGVDRWTIGEGSMLGVIRDLSNPGAHGMPPHPDHDDDLRRTFGSACSDTVPCAAGSTCRRGMCLCLDGTCDSGHVHSNSGILNHAHYLAAVGGTHASRGTSVTGVGVGKLERILFEAMAMLRPSMGFGAWRSDVLFTCRAFAEVGFSVGGGAIAYEDCGRILNAFAAVGVGARDRDEDSFDDDVDNCPNDFNPTQDPEDECVRDPYVHCRAFRYRTAFDRFREGVDIGFERNDTDSMIMVARCAFANRDYLTSESVARAAGGRGSPGEAAIAYFIAEYAAERMGRASDGYRESGLAAAADSGMCAGGTEEERAGCAGYQRAGTRAGLERE